MIIKMKIILVLVLDIVFYSSLSVQDGSGGQNLVMCGVTVIEKSMKAGYTFSLPQLPERCNTIVVGQYSLDDNPAISNEEMSIIQTITKANKPVYTYVGLSKSSDWGTILDPKNKEEFDTTVFTPFIKFITTSKMSGIIIYCRFLYENPNIGLPDLEKKFTEFVSKIRNQAPNIKIGFFLDGFDREKFKDASIFDFSLINESIDIYFIDWGFISKCIKETIRTGLTPAKSNNKCMTTGEMLTNLVLASKIDPKKIYALIEIGAMYPENTAPEGEDPYTSYTDYCSGQHPDWCISPSNVSYEQGVYAREKYVGIFIDLMTQDDFGEKCGCGPFPVTNQIIDGWTGSPFVNNKCPKLD